MLSAALLLFANTLLFSLRLLLKSGNICTDMPRAIRPPGIF